MVIVGGYNVYPREVDELLASHPRVQEAAAVGRPDERLGEVMVAFIVPVQGAELAEDDMLAFCRENLVKYKRPVELFSETGMVHPAEQQRKEHPIPHRLWKPRHAPAEVT